jgi:dienelactone hydrolase
MSERSARTGGSPALPVRRVVSRSLLTLLLVIFLWFLAVVVAPALRDPVRFFEARRSARFEVAFGEVEAREGALVQPLRVSGFRRSSGATPEVAFDGYWSRPAGASPPGLAVVVLGGIRTGREVMRLISARPETARLGVFLTLDYPYNGPRSFRGLEMLPWIPRVREALFDGVEAVRLAVDFLLTRPEVDPARIVLLGGSLGAFYVVDAGALDHRPAAVVAVMGGGRLTALFEVNLRSGGYVGTPLLSVPAAGLLGLLVRPLEPTRLVPLISPLPYVQISATGDERIPEANARALFEAAREPKKLVWMESAHVLPGREDVIEEMIARALAELRTLGLLPPDKAGSVYR